MIAYVPTEKIVTTPNPVAEQDHKPLIESIQRIGLQYPLLVRKSDNGYYHIIDGRTRFKALQHLGWREIPCITVNGNASVIEIDVEVYRRHLDKKTVENLQKKVRNAISEEIDFMIQSLRGMLPEEAIIKLENRVKEDIWKARKEIKEVYSLLNNIDLKSIEGYFTSDSSIHRDKEILQKRCLELEKELQIKTKKLDQIENEKKELKNNYEEIKKTLRSNLETLVEKRMESILSTIDEENAERYEEIKRQIREEVEEEYRREKEDLANKLREQSTAVKRLLEERDALAEAVKNEQAKLKNAQEYAEKLQDEYTMKKEIIRKAISPDGVFKRMGRIYEDIAEIDREILSLIDYINLLSEASLKLPGSDINKAIENLEKASTQVGKTINELKKTVKGLLK